MRKQLLLIPCLLFCFTGLKASAYVSQLPGLREAVAGHLELLNGEPSSDQKTVSAVSKAISAIDKTGGTALATDLKALASVSTTLSKSAASNDLGAALEATVNAYIATLDGDADDTETALNGAFPSGPRNGAQKNLAQARGYLDTAADSGNIPAAAKLLGKAATKLRVAASLTEKALAVPPPPASFTAQVTATDEGSFTFTPYPKESVQGVRDPNLGTIIITATYVKSGKGNVVQTRTINIILPNVPEGTTTYSLTSGGSAQAMYITQTSEIILNPPSSNVLFSESYVSTSGTLTITRNAAAKTAFGTFEFGAPGGVEETRSAGVSGSFSFTHN